MHPVIKTKTLKISLNTPYNYTRIVFQLIGKRLDTRSKGKHYSYMFRVPKYPKDTESGNDVGKIERNYLSDK